MNIMGRQGLEHITAANERTTFEWIYSRSTLDLPDEDSEQVCAAVCLMVPSFKSLHNFCCLFCT